MEDCTAEFDQLMLKGEFEEPEEHTIVRYLDRLNYEIANVINLQPYFSLHDVMKLALKVEKKNEAKGTVSTKYGVKSEITKRSSSKAPTTITTPKIIPKPLTKSEGKQPQTTTPSSQKRCFKC